MQVQHLLLPMLVAGLLPSASPAPEEILRSSDQKKLAKAVAEYWDALLEKDGINAAFQELAEEIDDVQKKLKDGPNVLAAVEDWERVFWMATEMGLEDRGLRKGRVSVEDEAQPHFTYHVDRRYSGSKGPFPMIIIVPEEGADPEEVLDAEWADEGLREGAILTVVHMKDVEAGWGSPDAVNHVMLTFGRASRRFGLDFDKVFLAGTGKGFAAAAATAASYSHLFAGLIGRGDVPETDVRNFRNTASRLSGGGEAFASAVKELGYGNCTQGDDTAAAIWGWIQETDRVAYPTHITFYPQDSQSLGAHWLKVEGVNLDANPKIDAVVDRDANTITIDADQIAEVALFFNDTLLDLDQPVKVVINGKTHEQKSARNRKSMIDLAFEQGDWGRVFCKFDSFDVPPKSSE